MLDFLSSFGFQSILKLILGFVLAGIIGAERESLNKPAGFKTHSIIGISAVLIMLCGEYLSKFSSVDALSIDASRIPAQFLSGIGFIGAGTILRDGFNVKGLTTAASLLAVTCIGLSIGAGFYFGGIIATLIVYIILSHSHQTSTIVSDHNIQFELVTPANSNVSSEVEKVLFDNNVSLVKISTAQSETNMHNIILLSCKYKGTIQFSKLIAELSKVKNVLQVEIHT